MEQDKVKSPPKGLAILAFVGPSFVWCAEYIGSGEVILATRTGAVLGPTILWAVVLGIFLKYWIGMSGARYTVCTGEGMIDMCGRMPGPKNWAIWIILVAQFSAAMISIGSIATAAGVFLSSLIPISPFIGGWIVTVFCVLVVWSGVFDVLKIFMSIVVFIVVIGVIYVVINIFPQLEASIFAIKVPAVPDWALAIDGINNNPWREILPLLGWGAGGFASQVWYTYWVLGAGYGAANGRPYGEPADEQFLKNMTAKTAQKIKSWTKVVYTDATIAMVIGVVVTGSFLLAGAGILRANQLAPSGPEVATTLSTLFSTKWGAVGGLLFMVAAAAALIGTQIGQLAGWPRLLADSFRLSFPNTVQKFSWKIQFRFFLVFFFLSNMIIVYSFGLKPVFLVKIAAILDGLLLTPLQALWIIIGLYIVMPKMLSQEAAKILKTHWIFGAGLIIAFLVFSYFCIFQIPFIF